MIGTVLIAFVRSVGYLFDCFDAFRAIVIFCRCSQIGVGQEVASDPDLVRRCNSPCGRSSIAGVMERDRSTSMRPTSS
jgi:hypothetical protein